MVWYDNVPGKKLEYTVSLNDKMEKYGTDTSSLGDDFILNTIAYYIWKDLGPTKKPSEEVIKELNRACVWMEGVVRRGEKATNEYVEYWQMYIDTYANLLYKAGRSEEAIKWEEFAILKLKETVKSKSKVERLTKEYEGCLDKMKKGETIWPLTD
jgi:hypothetical protein